MPSSDFSPNSLLYSVLLHAVTKLCQWVELENQISPICE